MVNVLGLNKNGTIESLCGTPLICLEEFIYLFATYLFAKISSCETDIKTRFCKNWDPTVLSLVWKSRLANKKRSLFQATVTSVLLDSYSAQTPT